MMNCSRISEGRNLCGCDDLCAVHERRSLCNLDFVCSGWSLSLRGKDHNLGSESFFRSSIQITQTLVSKSMIYSVPFFTLI